jgi:hypothetical protein
LRISSGGRAVTSLAVATTNTELVLSFSQVNRVARTREPVPPSVRPELAEPLAAFSSSSIHRTQGAMASATSMQRRMFASDSPTRLP